ncbi:TetR/AcrR family transcriptional regulator [Floccifex sp.]|uniref:TetR/AcrR family transcriptional regulator n=1 Tax=Floccifex sp. TaxID=2815810 RepID=UPI003F07EE84
MKREEKNQMTKRKIIDGALNEFSKEGYKGSSLNTICSEQFISKGIIYHYFKSKDELYLYCVEECFSLLTNYLKTHVIRNENPNIELEYYFKTRMLFFKEHPIYQSIFCEAVMNPPKKLLKEIAQAKKEFDEFNTEILNSILDRIPIRNNMSREDILNSFKDFQNFVNVSYPYSKDSFDDHEIKCHKAIDILLYGIVERGN